MREYYKEKIKNLIALRSSLFTCVIILTGGLVGLCFSDISWVKIIPLVILGAYFDFTFLQNMISTHREIDLILEDLKNECK